MSRAIKSSPILFNGDMVRAILAGAKTQTRRIVKPRPTSPSVIAPRCAWLNDRPTVIWPADRASEETGRHPDMFAKSPYGGVGDRMWVRENFQPLFAEVVESYSQVDYETGQGYAVNYPATNGRQEYVDLATDEICDRVTPSIHMPRWASRITLEITDVRVERVNAISEKNAIAEGCRGACLPAYVAGGEICGADGETPCDSFRTLWTSIYSSESWERDWVRVYGIKVL